MPAENKDGDSFDKNFLKISINGSNQILNQPAYFQSNSINSDFTGVPDAWKSINIVVGYREVLRRNDNHIMVKITEFHPIPGRIHYNVYNTGSWSGWKMTSAS